MKKQRLFSIVKTIIIGAVTLVNISSCCSSYVDTPDEKYLTEFQDQLFTPTMDPVTKDDLSLFVDYSTCIAEGQHSTFYNSLIPSFVSVTKKYYSIKGNQIQLEEGEVFQLLRTINEVNYADLKSAINQMSIGSGESVLLTDGEFFQRNIAKGNINNPYMADAFKKWLLRGHDIYIICEPYIEHNNGQNYQKKRFYILFTDNRLPGNIYDRIIQTTKLEDFPDVELFHFSADHPSLLSINGDCSSVNKLLEAKVLAKGSYEIQNWQLTWRDGIEPLIIGAVDENTGEPLPNGEYITKGIKVDRNSLGGYRISALEARVYNVNDLYMTYYTQKESGLKPSLETVNLVQANNFIKLNEEEFEKHGMVELNFDTQMFNIDECLTGSPYNYTKVDICIKEITPMFDQYADMFKFESIDVKGQTNVSVAESIKQCMANHEIKQKIKETSIYTIYIKSFER